MNKEPLDLMKEQLTRCSDAVVKNTKIITPGEIKQNYLLHISKHKAKEFIPYYSRVAAPSEDNTMVRVYTAPTLLGCIIGFSNLTWLFMNTASKSKLPTKTKISDYLGGLYIHKIPFDVALVPNKKLVFDADLSGETWLITYNEQTRKYPAEVIGRIVPNYVLTEPQHGKYSKQTTYVLVEITDKDGIVLDKDNYLTQGYWEVALEDDTVVVKAVQTTKAIFDENHKLKAALLSYGEHVAFASW